MEPLSIRSRARRHTGAPVPRPGSRKSAQLLVDGNPDALLIVDAGGVVQFANAATSVLFGRSLDELVGSTLGFPMVASSIGEMEIIRPDGSVLIAEIRVEAIHWQHQPAWLAAVRDITSRKRGEQLLIESQRFLRSILDAISEQIAILDSDGTILAINESWQEFARRAEADPYRSGVGYNYLSVCDMTTGSDAPTASSIAAGIRAVIAGTYQHCDITYSFLIDAREHWYEVHVSRFGEGEHTRAVVRHKDITARKRAEQLDQDRHHVLELVARQHPLFSVTSELLIMIANRYQNAIYLAMATRNGELFTSEQSGDDTRLYELINDWLQQQVRAEPGASGLMLEVQVPATHSDWQPLRDAAAALHMQRCWLLPIRSNSGGDLGLLAIGRRTDRDPDQSDYTFLSLIGQLAAIALDQNEQTRRLAHQAHHDTLTGLANRLLFADRLRQALEAARRSNHLVAVLFIDLDRFKQVNDTFGHSVGDLLLVELARRLEHCIRATDTLARRGGDEFMLVLPELLNSDQALRVANRLIDVLRQPLTIGNHELFVTASIGASLFPLDADDEDTLQRNADTAMYAAKSAMRNTFQFFDPGMNSAALERLQLENQLRRAVERAELSLFYQPQFDGAGRLVGAEALLRWHHPQLGEVAPARFISIAEDTGLIIPIGEWVLRESCRRLQQWQAFGLRPVRLAINVSAIQFAQANFVSTLAALLAEYEVAPPLIELELTESMLMGDQERVERQLQDLRSLGISLAIDDFGRGYSSLAYLQRLPINVLKIDRWFIEQLIDPAPSRNAAAIVSAMITLGHHLGLRVVAEGIETSAQRDFLQSDGCDEFQGYFFGVPMPGTQFDALLEYQV